MDSPNAYIPIDWRHALARGEQLPERATGAALFADISGFTPLTEALALELGPQRGAEELTVHLNNVYGALIADLHEWGGSVIGFSGDAMTCWLDGDTASARAVKCGLAMQATMAQFSRVETYSGRVVTMGIKVAVATGSARRFVVGDPDYRRLDVLAGVTLERLADAEGQAERGDVVVDEPTVDVLGDDLTIKEWREDEDKGLRFAVVTGFDSDVAPSPWPELPEGGLSDEVQSAWLLPPVYERLAAGLGNFLAELRTTFSMLLRFGGIDFENDAEAPSKLDEFIREIQVVLTRYEASLLQLTVGDKGSYAYISFGAPIAHEDDGIRAAATALEIQAIAERLEYLEPLQIGVTTGRMRTGAYGSETRRTYGALGDAVNLSARLMIAAKPGQILVSDAAKRGMGERFRFDIEENIKVKGKTVPVTVAPLLGRAERKTTGLLEPQYQLPMVGRKAEMALIEEKLADVQRGRGQVIGITAEAGMGKSRLSAEVIQAALAAGLSGLGGECQSYGTTTSYLPWQGIWRTFFKLDPSDSQSEQIATIETELRLLDPSLLSRLPLLGAVVNLTIPDNDLTRSLDAKVRKSSLEDLLVQCLQLRARIEPMLLVLEDCHWLDDLSRELVGLIGSAIGELPVLLLIVYRPPDRTRSQLPPVDKLPYFTEIELAQFSEDEVHELVALKLQQLYGNEDEVAPELVERIAGRTAGNPFYIEELLNFLRDLGIDPSDQKAMDAVELPNSIHALVLSRIDQLNESQQITMKVASVIGRIFQAAMVWGVYPDLEAGEVRSNLRLLSRLDLTPVESAELELSYLFKHIVTQQVAYESLLFSTRATLHEQIGLFIEDVYPEELDKFINLLAFHFEFSENQEKKREYLLRAGQLAQRDYANGAAISYYEKVLPLLTGRELADAQVELGKVHELIAAWDEAIALYTAAHETATEIDDTEALSWAKTALGEASRKQNKYDEATEWLTDARTGFESVGNQAGVGQALHYLGTIATQQGDFDRAREIYQESYTIREQLGDSANMANLLSNLGIVERWSGDADAAKARYAESLELREAIGDRWAMGVSLNNLGNLAQSQGDYKEAERHLERALLLWREIGERWAANNTLHNLANVARDAKDEARAIRLYTDSIGGWRRVNDNWGTAYWLEDCALFYLERNAPLAIQLLATATTLRDEIGSPRPPSYQSSLDETFTPIRDGLSDNEYSEALTLDEAIERAISSY